MRRLILPLFSMLALAGYQCLPLAKPKPINIVYIMADDHAAQAISAYGHPIGRLAPTPNIDRIAKNGALFQHNYCTNSICGPSRAVVLTGKHSHVNGFRMNGEYFDGFQPTFPKMFQKAGYRTGMIGKWHLHGKPQGFDNWFILQDQGNYYNPQFIFPDASGENDTQIINGYATDIISNKALEFLRSASQTKQPFLLMMHHKAPHRNWMPALRHANAYDSIQFPIPDDYYDEHLGQQAGQEQKQTVYRDMYEGHDLKLTKSAGSNELAHNPWTTDFDRMSPEQRASWNQAYAAKNEAFHKANLSGKDLAEYKLQRYLQDYLATIKAVDESVGAILDYLDSAGLSENTLVVYTTDQGFYLGERGWFDKRFMYEESLSMPLLMQLPGTIKPGTVVEQLTQNLDFAPSFLDWAGLEIPSDMQGQSMRPLFEKQNADFRDAIYYHYYDFPAFHMVKKHYGIRTKRYKLMHFYDDNDEWEFYDLEKDPREHHNAYKESNYQSTIAQLHTQLETLQKQYGVTPSEFDRAPKEAVDRAYENFQKLRGPEPELW